MAPKKPSAASRLDEAHAAHDQAKDRLAHLHADRNAALLRDDDTTALRLDAEIDIAERTVKACADKLALLRGEAEKEAAARRAKERSELISRIEKKLAQRDEVGRELGEALKQADALFCQLFDLAREIRSAWPWGPHDMPPTLLGDQAVIRAVEGEFYRIGARPALLGGMDRPRHPSLSGGKNPAHEFALQPDELKPLAEELGEASRMASEIMRFGKASGVTPVALVPAPPQAGGEPRERTDAEQRLAALLKKQLELSDDCSPAGDEAYAAVVKEISAVQAEIDQFRGLAANGGGQ